MALILQSFLEDKTVLKQLVTDGPGKTFILQKARRQINSLDPQEKIIFLEKTFAILSDPYPHQQDQRDAALDLLHAMDLTSVNKEGLRKAYVEAVSNLQEGLNQDFDPYAEIIDALLQAGKTIAPFIEKSQSIIQAWRRLADAFTGTEDDHDKILDDIEAIRRLIPGKFSELDKRVATCIEKGLRNQEIADEFREPLSTIKRSVARLKHKGMRSSRKGGPMRTEQQKTTVKLPNLP